MVSAIKFIGENNTIMYLMKVHKNIESQLSHEEINYVGFLEIKIFLSNSSNSNLDVDFRTLDENFNFCDKKKRELILFVRLLWSVN